VLIWCFTSGDLKIVREVKVCKLRGARSASEQKARRSRMIDFRTEDSIDAMYGP
jgi:uncharacterized protein YceH (UPF0502 family)